MLKSPFFFIGDSDDKEEKSNHYAFFLPASNYSFFTLLKEGAIRASETMDCAITFHEIDTDSMSFEMVPLSGVDGIGIYPYSKNANIIENLSKISAAGIPIIQIENEIFRDETTFFVGTNNFESGKAIAKLALKAKSNKLNIALVYSDKNPGLMSDGNLLELGLNSILNDKINLLQREFTNMNPLDAERLTYRLMRQEKKIDVIVFTDPNDTLVSVQAIIDMNLVGNVKIIGFGDDKIIQEYIDKELILGSIIKNPYHIGFSAVIALEELSNNGYTSAFVDTGISVLTKDEQGRVTDE